MASLVKRGAHFSGRILRDTAHLFWRNVGFKTQPGRGYSSNIISDHTILQAVSGWLLRAAGVCRNRGIAANYDLFRGWGKPYLETTGYIIETFLNLARYFKEKDYFILAVSNGKWLLEHISPDGGVAELGKTPIIFNTGQVMHGLISLFEETGDENFRSGVEKTSGFIARRQSPDGAFRRDVFLGVEHDYNVRVAWGLLRAAKILNNADLYKSGLNNIDYVIKKSSPSSYPFQANTKLGKMPHTHGIAYTFQGILEAGYVLNDATLVEWVRRGAVQLQKRFESEGRLACYIDEHWQNFSYFDCLTGNCQIAIIWLELAQFYKDCSFLDSAMRIIDLCKSHVAIKAVDKNAIGGVPGSFPIFGAYSPFSYPNWAAKFMIDALLTKQKVISLINHKSG